MAVVTFANSKGGSGKTTSALILACELAEHASVCLIDADPRRPLTTWAKLPGKPERLTVVTNASEKTILDEIDAASAGNQFVIVDLEGTASTIVGYAISRADLVIIPTQGSPLDAVEAAKAVKLVRRMEKVAGGKTISAAILFTRTSAAIRPRTLQAIAGEFAEAGIPTFKASMNERDAFRAIFAFGGTLAGLDAAQVSNVEAAIANARTLMAEVVAKLSEPGTAQPQAKVA